MKPVAPHTPKPDAARTLLQQAGIPADDVYHDVESRLQKLVRTIEPIANRSIVSLEPTDPDSPALQICFTPPERQLPGPVYLNGRPDYFPGYEGEWQSCEEPFGYVDVPDGFFAALPDAPVVFDRAMRMLRVVGSKYKDVIWYYDFDVTDVLRRAQVLDVTAIPILDDVWSLNYCHWICDWLPRLELVRRIEGRRPKVITTPITSSFQRDSLRMLGFEDEEIIQLDRLSAVRCRRLIVPNDLGNINHPSHKGAAWSLGFLRRGLLPEAQKSAPLVRPESIYVSRSDAGRRGVANEAELEACLRTMGFVKVTPGQLPLSEQLAIFSGAKRIVGIHGAGLVNVLFAAPGTKVLEITPRSYGMPSFAVLAAAGGMPYATFISDVVAGKRAQADDLLVDVAEFAARASTFL